MSAPEHRGVATAPPWLAFVAARYKAVVALLVPLAGGLVAAFPHNTTARAVAAVVTALVSAGLVHQVPNLDLPVAKEGTG